MLDRFRIDRVCALFDLIVRVDTADSNDYATWTVDGEPLSLEDVELLRSAAPRDWQRVSDLLEVELQIEEASDWGALG